MNKLLYTTLLSLFFTFGCSDPNIDLVKESRLNTDENFTVEQAFDNRKLCEGVEWISTTDDVGRDIVEYHCNLIKPIAAIKEVELKRIETKKKSIAKQQKLIDYSYKIDTKQIKDATESLEEAKRSLNNQQLENTLSKLEKELGKEAIGKSRDIPIRKLLTDSYGYQYKIRDLENSRSSKEQQEAISVMREKADRLQKLYEYFDTESKLERQIAWIEIKEGELDNANERTRSSASKIELEEIHIEIENLEKISEREIISIHEVFKFLIVEESYEVIEAGLVFELDYDGEEKTVYKKYSDRQLYLHVEDIYEPNAFSSTIRARHYTNL